LHQQLEQLQRMGGTGDTLAGTPGREGRSSGGVDPVPSLRRIRGMLDAMTRRERDSPDILDKARCRRIAAGAGVAPEEVERLLVQLQQVRVLMQEMAQMTIWREGGA
jgi:signal recognition particle subunit SRP54